MLEKRLKTPFSFILILLQTGSTLTDITVLLKEYCPGIFECETKSTSFTESSQSNCLGCSCDSYCTQMGNCCPTLHQPSFGRSVGNDKGTFQQYNSSINKFVCVVPRSNLQQINKDESSVRDGLGLYMVSSCSQEVVDERCKNSNPEVLKENLPHTSVQTGITYKNIYCGMCNNDVDLIPWKPYITCSDGYLLKADEYSFPISVEKLFRLAVTSEKETCGVEFRQPRDFDPSNNMCYANEPVRNCSLPDEFLRNACRSFLMPYFHQQNNKTTVYANVFCFLCRNDTSVSDNEFNDLLTFPVVTNDLIGELNVNSSDRQNIGAMSQKASEMAEKYDTNCEQGFIFDPFQRECRQWYCPVDYAAINGTCVPILKTFETATYQVRLTAEGNKEYLGSLDSFSLMSNLLSAMFKSESKTETDIILIAGNQTKLSFFVVAVVQIHSIVNRTAALGLGQFNRAYRVEVDFNKTLLFNVRLARDTVVELASFPLSQLYVFDMKRFTPLPVLYLKGNATEVFQYPLIEKLMFCLQIILEVHEYIDFIVNIRIVVTQLALSEGEYIRIPQSRKVRVCYDDYLKGEQLFQKHETTESRKPQVIVSVICTLLSISCLAMTIFTYIIFRELRSIPGKNNILLSVHLLVAQLLYQFAFSYTENPELCVIFGICIHFFWLTAILWMSACTVHMFRTFVTKKSVNSKRALDPQVCIYTIYCYLIAAVAVSINIGISWNISGGKSIGYGGKMCYISTPIMIGLTFALPVGIIIVLNLLFFVIVIYKISESTMRFAGQSTDRYNAVIYMKLSSLTGVAWIFGYIYIWTRFPPVEYAFIVLNAGQGVLIFFSFICNNKIFHMYRELFIKYGRQLSRTFCSKKTHVPIPKQKPVENMDVKTTITSNSNKSPTCKSISNDIHFSNNPLPTCLTAVASNKALAVNGCEMDGMSFSGLESVTLSVGKI